MKYNIYLGSTSKHKIAAVQEACGKAGIEAEVIGVKAASEQDEQPFGMEAIIQGAITRAENARKGHEQQDEEISIGIESGILGSGQVKIDIDLAAIVIIKHDGSKIVTTSTGIQFPNEYVDIAAGKGFDTTTVGSVIAKKLGGDGTDPHATLTGGKVTRAQTLIDGLVAALLQL